MRTRYSLRQGFTLIEIMIVVAIIGLLMAVAIPNLMKAQRTAKKNACIANLKSIEGMKVQWALDNKKGDNDTPPESDIAAMLNKKPECPAGGTYTMGSVVSKPICSVAEHVLPE